MKNIPDQNLKLSPEQIISRRAWQANGGLSPKEKAIRRQAYNDLQVKEAQYSLIFSDIMGGYRDPSCPSNKDIAGPSALVVDSDFSGYDLPTKGQRFSGVSQK